MSEEKTWIATEAHILARSWLQPLRIGEAVDDIGAVRADAARQASSYRAYRSSAGWTRNDAWEAGVDSFRTPEGMVVGSVDERP